jgi:probable phosphoglycerate mutase
VQILLIRHGRTPSNIDRVLDTAFPGADLDETGRAQAHALVSTLAEDAIDAIYVSDLPRTQQTAAPLALARGLSPAVRPGLREIQAGDYEMSADWSGYLTTVLAWRTDADARMPGGETGREVLDRFDSVVAEACSSGHGSVVMVSHGAVIRTWSAARADNITAAFLRTASLDNTVVVRLEGRPGTGWTVTRWGDAVPG